MRDGREETAGRFRPVYAESEIGDPVLWEKHCHGQLEMIAVLEGDVSVILEGKSYRLTKGQTLIIPPLTYHTVTANEGGTYRRVTSLFELSSIPEPLRCRFSGEGAEPLIAESEIGERLRELCLREDGFYRPLVESLMVQLLYESAEGPSVPDGTQRDELLQRAVEYIDSHLHEKILLADLARYTARSKSSFCHLFEKKMGISPKQYILQKKLALANQMIAEGASPTEAAAGVGYESYSNFYRLYRRRLGISPSEGKGKGGLS